MEHSVREEQGAVIASFSGDVDLEHSPKAREVLLECVERARKVLVDLSGVEYIDKPEGYGLQKRNEYTANDYHKVTDEVKPDWDMAGAAEDLTFLYLMGRRLADGEEWPSWSETSEFRALRELQRPQ